MHTYLVLANLNHAVTLLDAFGVYSDAHIARCFIVVHAAFDSAVVSWLGRLEEVAMFRFRARLDLQEIIKVQDTPLAACVALGPLVKNGHTFVIPTRLLRLVSGIEGLFLHVVTAAAAACCSCWHMNELVGIARLRCGWRGTLSGWRNRRRLVQLNRIQRGAETLFLVAHSWFLWGR